MDKHSGQVDLSCGPHLDAQQSNVKAAAAAKEQTAAGPGHVVNASITHVSGVNSHTSFCFPSSVDEKVRSRSNSSTDVSGDRLISAFETAVALSVSINQSM